MKFGSNEPERIRICFNIQTRRQQMSKVIP